MYGHQYITICNSQTKFTNYLEHTWTYPKGRHPVENLQHGESIHCGQREKDITRRFKWSRIGHCNVELALNDVSEDCTAFIFRIKNTSLFLHYLTPKIILRNVENFLPRGTSNTAMIILFPTNAQRHGQSKNRYGNL